MSTTEIVRTLRAARRRNRPASALAIAGALILVGAPALMVAQEAPGARVDAPPGEAIAAARRMSRVAAPFEADCGQLPAGWAFAARAGWSTVFAGDDGFTIQSVIAPDAAPHRPAAFGSASAAADAAATVFNLRFAFEGAAAGGARAASRGRPDAELHSYIGSDPAAWRTSIPGWNEIVLEGVAPGAEAILRSVTPRRMEYDLAFASRAKVEDLIVRCEGALGLALEDGGRVLRIETPFGPVRQDLPGTWQTKPDGTRELLVCRFRLVDASRFGFAVDGRDPALPLVIDPGIIYATFFGGGQDDTALAAAVFPTGVLTIGGQTASAGLPTTPGAHQATYAGAGDAFVTRFSANGQAILWSTYIGGSNWENVNGLALDPTGGVAAVGSTASTNFPTSPGAFATVNPGSTYGLFDAIVVRLTAAGTLVYATAIGSSGNDVAHAVGFDAAGRVLAGGYSNSAQGFPVTAGAYDATYGSGGYYGDAFLAKLSANGTSLVFSTYLGGGGNDSIDSLAVDPTGDVVVTGFTQTLPGIPPGSWDATFGGSSTSAFPQNALGDAFVARISANGSALVWAGYIGGSKDEFGSSVAIAPTGEVYAAGFSYSNDLAGTPGAFAVPDQGGLCDGYVAKINATGTSLLALTHLGGQGEDRLWAMALDAGGAPIVAGDTASTNFPTSGGCLQPANAGGSFDAFVTRLDPSLTRITYSSLLGGSAEDGGRALALDGRGGAFLAGRTLSPDFPAPAGGFDPSFNGASDAFVAHLDLLPAAVQRYGTTTPGCRGNLVAGVNSYPQVGNAGFGFHCLAVPPNATGWLVLSGTRLTTPFLFSGAAFWVNPGLTNVSLASSSSPSVESSFPIPPWTAAGLQGFAQFVWVDPCAAGGVSASDALDVTIQP